MQLTEKHKEYWSRNLRLTAVLLFIWFVVTYVMAWFAIPLAEINFFGWPLVVLHGGAGIADHLRADHLVLREGHAQDGPRVRRG